jgi:hypothetical protein
VRCWVFCLWDISELQIPEECVPESKSSYFPTLRENDEGGDSLNPEKDNDHCFSSIIGRMGSPTNKLPIQYPHFHWGLVMVHPRLVAFESVISMRRSSLIQDPAQRPQSDIFNQSDSGQF